MSNADLSGWEYYIHNSGWMEEFLHRFPEFSHEGFWDYVVAHNRADRDHGELGSLALHEVLRLAAEFAERRWRFPNVHGQALTAREAKAVGRLASDELRGKELPYGTPYPSVDPIKVGAPFDG